MINGVVFLEEQADYLLLLGKEGLYTVQAENDHWNVHYTLPGDTSNLDKQFISKDEALQDVYEMDNIWRRNRWKFLPMKEAGFFPQNRTFPPREENVSITFQADTEITSDDGIINVSYLWLLLFSR